MSQPNPADAFAALWAITVQTAAELGRQDPAALDRVFSAAARSTTNPNALRLIQDLARSFEERK